MESLYEHHYFYMVRQKNGSNQTVMPRVEPPSGEGSLKANSLKPRVELPSGEGSLKANSLKPRVEPLGMKASFVL